MYPKMNLGNLYHRTFGLTFVFVVVVVFCLNHYTSTIYAASFHDSGGNAVLYSIDRSNPKDTRISEIPIDGNGPEGVAVNPKTNRVYSLYTDDNGTTNFAAVIDRRLSFNVRIRVIMSVMSQMPG